MILLEEPYIFYVATLSFMSKTANKGGNIIVPVGGYFVFKGGQFSIYL
jgi:hypothetical protein